MRYKIILAGSHGGTLDERAVETEAEIKDAVRDLVDACDLAAGDTLSIVDTKGEA